MTSLRHGESFKLDILSGAQIGAVIMASMGLFMGVLYSVGGLVYELYMGIPLNLGTILAFGALVGMPLIFAIPGIVIGAIVATIYNAISKKV